MELKEIYKPKPPSEKAMTGGLIYYLMSLFCAQHMTDTMGYLYSFLCGDGHGTGLIHTPVILYY